LGKLRLQVPVSAEAAMDSPAFELPRPGAQAQPPQAAAVETPSLAVWVALPLALAAGLILNLMPCVWPVLPIIVTRLLEQSRHSRRRSVGLGVAFAGGIVLFFVALAVVNVVLRLGFGTALQWGEPFRNPAFLIGMVLLLVVLALFMFGVVTFAVPSSVTGRGGGGKGVGGSVATGFLAAVLSTPCSFAPLTAAFAWAQTQPLVLSTVAILLIGVGMAVPYVVLTAIPGLLHAIPKPGRWMELLKQGLGFVLLFIAIELLSALPEVQKAATSYGAVVLAFCVWMWGGWVGYATPPLRKWLVRGAGAGLAVAAGVVLFGPEEKLVDWQAYDAARIQEAVGRKQPVLVEFMADWCLSCKAVEKTVYERRDVADLIKGKGVLAVRADTTLRDYPAAVDLKDVYNEPAVPVTILLLPGEAGPMRLRGLLIREALVGALEALPDAKDLQGSELER
jgi:thiol:disulfide interchange protein DsbD